jgi:hypothetical protein
MGNTLDVQVQEQKSEPWRPAYGAYVDRQIIDKEIAEYLYNYDFRSVEILQELPTDVRQLRAFLHDCPGIEKGRSLAAITYLVKESKKVFGCQYILVAVSVCQKVNGFAFPLQTISPTQTICSNQSELYRTVKLLQFCTLFLLLHYSSTGHFRLTPDKQQRNIPVLCQNMCTRWENDFFSNWLTKFEKKELYNYRTYYVISEPNH